MFSLLLPITAVLYDNQVLRVKQRSEHKFLVLVKLLIILVFWNILLFTYISFQNDPKEMVTAEISVRNNIRSLVATSRTIVSPPSITK